MAVASLNTTTLTSAITVSDNNFAVGSTTNISVGNLLVFAGTGGLEAMKVQEIPVSGRVKVLRGWNGTRARAHAASTLIYIGTPDAFKTIRDSALALAGDSGNFPDYMLPGSRARDGAGNEYVLVDSTMTVVPLATVVISRDGLFTASILTNVSQGSVGVITEDATSDQYVWAQIYGKTDVKVVIGSSIATSLGEFQGASSVSTPSVGLLALSSSQRSSAYGEKNVIYGMYPTRATTTGTTAATSETGLRNRAWLNYPFVMRPITS